MTKNKLSNKSKSHFKEIADQVQGRALEQADIDREIATKNKKLLKFFETIDPWAELYSLSHQELVAYFYIFLGFGEKVIATAKAEDKEEANMALFRELRDQEEGGEFFDKLDSLDEAKRSTFLSILMAMQGNMEGIKRYHETVSELIAKADKDNESLLKAVAVDRSAVANTVIARVISQAQLRQDESFMALLAKSVTRTKPIRKPNLDVSRLMLEIINDVVGLKTISYQEIAEVLLDLEVYPDGGADPDGSIKKLVQKRNSLKGK